MKSGSRCPAFYGEIPPMRWGILDDDGGYFYCITYTCSTAAASLFLVLERNVTDKSLLPWRKGTAERWM